MTDHFSPSPPVPGRSGADFVAENEAQVKCASVNQQALEDVVLVAQMCSSHAAGCVALGEAAFEDFAAPPIDVDRVAFPGCALPGGCVSCCDADYAHCVACGPDPNSDHDGYQEKVAVCLASRAKSYASCPGRS